MSKGKLTTTIELPTGYISTYGRKMRCVSLHVPICNWCTQGHLNTN